jgi:hypothetical protein
MKIIFLLVLISTKVLAFDFSPPKKKYFYMLDVYNESNLETIFDTTRNFLVRRGYQFKFPFEYKGTLFFWIKQNQSGAREYVCFSHKDLNNKLLIYHNIEIFRGSVKDDDYYQTKMKNLMKQMFKKKVAFDIKQNNKMDFYKKHYHHQIKQCEHFRNIIWPFESFF